MAKTSVSPSGETFPLPHDDEYTAEFARIESLAEASRARRSPGRAGNRPATLAPRGVRERRGLRRGLGPLHGVGSQQVFRFAGMEPMRHPETMAYLAMVIGLYGVLCAEVARGPERGFLLAAGGPSGKLLGPAGLAVLIAQQSRPLASAVLCVSNDAIWWLPFALYLHDAWPFLSADLG